MKINFKNNKGTTTLDMTTGVIIFVLFTSLILTLYLNIYKQASLIKIHEDAMSYLTKICEAIDLKAYDDTDDVNAIAREVGLPTDKYKISYTIEKYTKDHPEAEDLVKRINITLLYTFDKETRTIEISKIKVKE